MNLIGMAVLFYRFVIVGKGSTLVFQTHSRVRIASDRIEWFVPSDKQHIL